MNLLLKKIKLKVYLQYVITAIQFKLYNNRLECTIKCLSLIRYCVAIRNEFGNISLCIMNWGFVSD